VPTTGREPQGRLGRYSDELSIWIERVNEREEVMSVGGATVMQDQRPARLPVRRADLVGQHVKIGHLRGRYCPAGFGSGHADADA
jgi:hypothetical protein